MCNTAAPWWGHDHVHVDGRGFESQGSHHLEVGCPVLLLDNCVLEWTSILSHLARAEQPTPCLPLANCFMSEYGNLLTVITLET
jgi:hypothetical protein